jgi:hypothetical protein
MGEKSGNLALQHFPSYIACVCGHLRCENTNSCRSELEYTSMARG